MYMLSLQLIFHMVHSSATRRVTEISFFFLESLSSVVYGENQRVDMGEGEKRSYRGSLPPDAGDDRPASSYWIYTEHDNLLIFMQYV